MNYFISLKQLFIFYACITIYASNTAMAQNGTCDYKSKTSFVFDDLVSLIKNPSCEVKNIKDVIAKLPDFMSKNTILVNRSQSLQGPHKTDYVFPRAILNSFYFFSLYSY